MAKSYYQMANNLVENNECVRLGMILKQDFRDLELYMQKSIDANQKWQLGENSLNHPLKGYLEFKGQQSLVILLKLLMSESNRVFSKEEIVRTLWQEEYNPLIHDNRIYVTVKRLRVFLEVNYKSPQYLIRKRGGYLFNQEI
jgi:DNA-binding winged helix-turn-helix (wHTH) protein